MTGDIRIYSDPTAVRAKGKRIGVDVKPSTRRDKKYMVEHEGKKIHFGQMGYEDYSRHKDEKRRERFRQRNRKWATAPKSSAAYWAYHLLW